jgi:hypothetical protein
MACALKIPRMPGIFSRPDNHMAKGIFSIFDAGKAYEREIFTSPSDSSHRNSDSAAGADIY